MSQSATPSKLAVIFAGEDIPAQLLDGTTSLVRVRAMPVRHLAEIVSRCTSEAALLEFVCFIKGDAGWQPVAPEWVDNLDDASHIALVEAAKRLNFSRAVSWGQRQIAAGEMKTSLMLQTDEMMSPVVERMARLLISSLKLSGSPGEPSTKS